MLILDLLITNRAERHLHSNALIRYLGTITIRVITILPHHAAIHPQSLCQGQCRRFVAYCFQQQWSLCATKMRLQGMIGAVLHVTNTRIALTLQHQIIVATSHQDLVHLLDTIIDVHLFPSRLIVQREVRVHTEDVEAQPEVEDLRALKCPRFESRALMPSKVSLDCTLISCLILLNKLIFIRLNFSDRNGDSPRKR